MAATLTERMWRPSSLDRIESDLMAVWTALAREAPVARAALSNLIVFCRTTAGATIDLESHPVGIPLEQVSSHHPARVIVLHHDPDSSARQPAPTGPNAHVGVVTFGPPDARFGVEQIVVRTSCGDVALPSIVRPLLRGDIPTSVWWTEDFSTAPPLASLVAMGRQLVYDSRLWRDVRAAVVSITPLLFDKFGPDLADVNWRRLAPLRQALVHAIRSSGGDGRAVPETIRIAHQPTESALAWLLAGWLEQILGKPGIAHRPAIAVEAASPPGEDVLTLSFGEGLELRLSNRSVTVTDALGPAPFAMAVPQEHEADAVAAELRVLTQDVSFRGALTSVAERLARV
jgi:glucose-6-phosphate dehydrogenase assembly protein OpcA